MKRCDWSTDDPIMIKYHDLEWGVPMHDDKGFFEFLVLEGMQAGLSWMIILKKRDNFRRAFDNFDPLRVSKYTEKDFKRLINDAGIIRNRLKIRAAIQNAKAFLDVKKEFGSFDKYNWSFVEGKPIKNKFKKLSDLPAKTKIAEKMSEDLLKRGFKFVGPTIVYAHMQATGMVNDHVTSCFRYKEV